MAVSQKRRAEMVSGWSGRSLTAMTKYIKDARDELDAAKKVVSKLQEEYDVLTIDYMPERMDEEDVQNITVPDVGRLQLAPGIRCSCPEKNRGALYAWMKDNGHASLVTSTINSSTLSGFVREQMKLGKDGSYPKDILKILPYSRATVVKV